MPSYNINEIQPTKVHRVKTGFDELDWLYGYNRDSNPLEWGMPLQAISLWAGASGTGKSRVAIEVAKNMAKRDLKVLYFQNEIDLGTFSSWIKKDIANPHNFRISEDSNLEDQINTIMTDRPNIVFVDSVNMIEEFKSGTKRDIELIINSYREITKKLKVHVIFIAQLNQDGSVKGSTTLPHLVDIVMNLEKDDTLDSLFCIKVGLKHRYGRTGSSFKTIWQHRENGVDVLSSARLSDEKWRGKRPVVKKRKKILGFI